MNKVKQFFLITGYEFKRIIRNKLFFGLLLCFIIAIFIILSITQTPNFIKFPLTMYTDGADLDKVPVFDIIKENFRGSEIKFVNSKEEGIDLVNKGESIFFICLKNGDEKTPTTATFFYDQTNVVDSGIASDLMDKTNKLAYEGIIDFLSQYGIKLKEEYFKLLVFEPIATTMTKPMQATFAIEVASCLTLFIALGVVFSLARDNETNVSKNISYIPIGINKYLFSKFLPYLIMAILETIIIYVIGILLFNINFALNLGLVILLTIPFLFSALALCLLSSLCKSQIAAILLNLITVILPLFFLSAINLSTCPLIMQIVMYCLPITPFVNLLSHAMFNGIVIWWTIPILVAQVIVYYSIAYLVMRKRVKGQ